MKQIKKLSLSNMIGKLTRNEMRSVMAGSGSEGGECKSTNKCSTTCATFTNATTYTCDNCCVA